MYKNTCKHCHVEIESETHLQFSNHVRWCNPEVDKSKSKFITQCSCVLCRKETTVQSLKAHLAKHDAEHVIKAHCEWCNKPIYAKPKRFCNASCAAHHSNSIVDRTKFTPGPEKSWCGPRIPAHILRSRRNECTNTSVLHSANARTTYYTIVDQVCKVCQTTFTKKSTSHKECCSKECRMSIISLNRGRHKRSWLETSFSEWLDSYRVSYSTEVKFTNADSNTWYFVDFLFEQRKLIIELDGSQHKHTVEKDRLRDQYLQSIGYHVIRVTHKEYQSKSRIEEIKMHLGL